MASTTETSAGDLPLTPQRSRTASACEMSIPRPQTPFLFKEFGQSFHSKQANCSDTVSVHEDALKFGHDVPLSPTPESVSSTLLTQERQKISSDAQHSHKESSFDRVHRVLIPEDETIDGQTRIKNLQRIRDASVSLTELRDGMQKTLLEYFHHKTLIRFFELRTFEPTYKALDILITTIDRLADSLTKRVFFKDTKDANYLTFQLRLALGQVIEEGDRILGLWNKRDDGQSVDEPLTGKSRQSRKILICDSSELLVHWTKTINTIETEMLNQHAYREPAVKQNLRTTKWFTWIKYMSVTGKNFDVPEEPLLQQNQHPSPSMFYYEKSGVFRLY